MSENVKKQDQHVIPQVYLKQFGYLNGEQWKVSVFEFGKTYVGQKSIGSYTAISNHFDIESADPDVIRLYENLNKDIENEYRQIIEELTNDGKIGIKSESFLKQMIGNLIFRSKFWRTLVLSILESENRSFYTKAVLLHRDPKANEKYKSIEQNEQYKFLMQLEPNKALNRMSLHFMDYIVKLIERLDVVILKSPKEREWWSSDTPVIIDRNTPPNSPQIIGPRTNIFFPISKNFLAFLYLKSSPQKHYYNLSNLSNNIAHISNYTLFHHISMKIRENANEFLIIANKYYHKKK